MSTMGLYRQLMDFLYSTDIYFKRYSIKLMIFAEDPKG